MIFGCITPSRKHEKKQRISECLLTWERESQNGGIPETQMVAKLSCRFHGMSLPFCGPHDWLLNGCKAENHPSVFCLSLQSICSVIPFISPGLSVSLFRWQVLSMATDYYVVFLCLNEKCFLTEVIDSSCQGFPFFSTPSVLKNFYKCPPIFFADYRDLNLIVIRFFWFQLDLNRVGN